MFALNESFGGGGNEKQGKNCTSYKLRNRGLTGHFLYSRIPPVENGPFRLDFFRLHWSFFLIISSVESIL